MSLENYDFNDECFFTMPLEELASNRPTGLIKNVDFYYDGKIMVAFKPPFELSGMHMKKMRVFAGERD